MHFLIVCPTYKNARFNLFHQATKETQYFNNLNNTEKFLWLMISENHEIIKELSDYIKESFEIRTNIINQGPLST